MNWRPFFQQVGVLRFDDVRKFLIADTEQLAACEILPFAERVQRLTVKGTKLSLFP
jgi:hypothetical protein